MAILDLHLQDYEVEPSELSISVWEAPAFLEDNSISPEDLHSEWTALDLYIQNDCTTALHFERVAQWVAEGDLTDAQLNSLSYRIAQVLLSRLHNVRRELERATAPDAERA